MKKNPSNLIGLALLSVAPVAYFWFRQDIYDAQRKYLGLSPAEKSGANKQGEKAKGGANIQDKQKQKLESQESSQRMGGETHSPSKDYHSPLVFKVPAKKRRSPYFLYRVRYFSYPYKSIRQQEGLNLLILNYGLEHSREKKKSFFRYIAESLHNIFVTEM